MIGCVTLYTLYCCRLAVADAPILLPQNGPLIIGATSDQDADVLIDEPRVSGRHARLEIVPCNGGSKCNKDYRWAPTEFSMNEAADHELISAEMLCDAPISAVYV